MHRAAERIAQWRGRRVVVLATGDPMWYGGGANLARSFGPDEMTVIPHPGAFSLAAARMLWPLADVECVTVHGRPLQVLNLHIQPKARLLVLSRDGDTPAQAAALLVERGFGPSAITVLEHLGGPRERRLDGIAERLASSARSRSQHAGDRVPAGSLAAPAAAGARPARRAVRERRPAHQARGAGSDHRRACAAAGPDAVGRRRRFRFCRHRMAARRASLPRAAGGGEARAIAVERDADRCACIARNATALGVPQLEVVHGEAPDALSLKSTRRPDTIFLGGGVATPGLLDRCWDALPAGGRLVANAVSLEAGARLVHFRRAHGGELTRLAVSRAAPVGKLSAFRPLMEVTQYVGMKP